MAKHRYPGVTPFNSDQQNVFFGRDQDIERLHNLIYIRNQVLLYSKSGIGKTSLLNAGVLPKFEKEYTIINVRLFAYNPASEENISPLENVIRAVKDLSGKTKIATPELDEIIKDKPEHSLWYHFKRYQKKQGIDEKYILVFDQFEELFSYPEAEIEDFKEQLYELLKLDVPNKLIRQISKIEDKAVKDELFKEINIKTVFAIRSDRLSELNRLTDKFPDLQETYYELRPLNREQAKSAVLDPASAKGKYTTRTFEFTPEAVSQVLDHLFSEDANRLESTQLQIVCSRIENEVQEKQKGNLKKIKITKDDLPGFDDIFLTFYRTAVGRTEQKTEAFRFIEDQLIRNGQRISMDSLMIPENISEETLRILTDSHLLRREPNSTGGVSYELSHDTLIEPVLAARKKRLSIEEAEFIAEQQKEELRRQMEDLEKDRAAIEAERKLKTRNRILASIVGVVLATLMSIAFYYWNNAEILRDAALESKEKLDKSNAKLIKGKKENEAARKALEEKRKELDSLLLNSANREFELENFDNAIVLYEQVLAGDSTDTFALERKQLSINGKGKAPQFNNLMERANYYLRMEDLIKAQTTIKELEDLDYSHGTAELNRLVDSYESKREKVVQELIDGAKSAMKDGSGNELVLGYLKYAKQLDPGNRTVSNMITKVKSK